MAEYEIYQADAFTGQVFRGNPAAYVPLTEWLPDEMLLAIAVENNLSETAYTLKKGPGHYDLRWFTPGAEVPLCGHATLVTSHLLYTEFGETAETLIFETLSGPLHVSRDGDYYVMDFPAANNFIEPHVDIAELTDVLGEAPVEVIEDNFVLAVFDTAEKLRALAPDLSRMMQLGTGIHKGCVLTTAPGDQGYDFVSRLFAPGVGIPEDPVTGSAHCMTTPYWAGKLGKTSFKAWQASPRGGEVLCELKGDRVIMKGKAVTYMRGRITV
jgi:PhzF family phenazine biosynthesis protein